MTIGRRHLIGAALLPLARPALAQARPTLRVQVTSGLVGKVVTDSVVPAFEAAHGAQVQVIVDDDTTMLPKLQVARGRSPYDVVMLDNDKAILGAGMGLWAPDQSARLANLPAIYDSCKPPATAHYGSQIYEYALVYDKAKFPVAPASWNDLWTPGIVAGVPDIRASYGMTFLYIAALLNGGSEHDLDPGFAAIKRLGRFKVYKNVSEGLSLFQQQEIDAALFYSHRAQQMIDAGLPIGKATPKEGSWGQRTGTQLPRGGANAELALAWIDATLGVPFQSAFFANLYSPTNRDCRPPADLAGKLILGADRVNAIREAPWAVLLPQRDAIVDRWNKEFGM
jgi:putative spermidine/putrescine transport system substrate-binding protein